MDAGDGRHGSILYPNATNGVVEKTAANNESDGGVEFKGFVTDNPDLWFYQLVHFLSVVTLIIFGLIKGLTCAVQFLKGSKRFDQIN